jgi:phosphate transport system permease protein
MGISRVAVDKINSRVMLVLTVFATVTIFFMMIGLFFKSLPVLRDHSLTGMLFSSDWSPLKGKFGMWPYILSTLWVTAVAITLAVPLCILTAIYLSEYADKRILKIANPFLDILAGLPSVIYGVWGILMIIPLVRDFIAPTFGMESTGYSILTGGLVLSVMVFPIIIHILIDVFKTIPQDLRDASLALGATKWQTIKFVVLRKSLTGIISAVVLGLSRAFGETLAVLMVVGNVVNVPKSVFDPAYPLPALIANNYGEMLSIPMYDSALMFAALVLFMIIFFFNAISRYILMQLEKSSQ